jgi:hypothetical protein
MIVCPARFPIRWRFVADTGAVSIRSFNADTEQPLAERLSGRSCLSPRAAANPSAA